MQHQVHQILDQAPEYFKYYSALSTLMNKITKEPEDKFRIADINDLPSLRYSYSNADSESTDVGSDGSESEVYTSGSDSDSDSEAECQSGSGTNNNVDSRPTSKRKEITSRIRSSTTPKSFNQVPYNSPSPSSLAWSSNKNKSQNINKNIIPLLPLVDQKTHDNNNGNNNSNNRDRLTMDITKLNKTTLLHTFLQFMSERDMKEQLLSVELAMCMEKQSQLIDMYEAELDKWTQFAAAQTQALTKLHEMILVSSSSSSPADATKSSSSPSSC